MSLATKCMIVNLHIGRWTGQRLDREATARATTAAGAAADAGRFNKHLIPKSALKALESAGGAIRAHYNKNTLPWKDNGDRLLTRRAYVDFMAEHGEMVRGYMDLVEEFVTKGYPSEVARAQFRMGDMFDISDYPRPAAIRDKFYVTLDVDAVSDAGDFRMDIAAADKAKVVAEIETATEKRLNAALADVWQRVADAVGHYQGKMDSDGIFRDTTVTNVQTLVDMLPRLNLMDDPDLERIGSEIERVLCGITPKELRKNPEIRAAAADDASRIMDDMAGLMNAFGAKAA